MGFGEITSAIRIREVVTSIATDVVNRLRPEERIGTVFSFTPSAGVAQILFPGETVDSLVEVGFSKANVPVRAMSDTYSTQGMNATGDIVRVGGKPGAYYIIDFVSGSSTTTAGSNPTGTVVMWATPDAPEGYLICNGSTFSSVDYPKLALVLGDTFGLHLESSYYLPDFRGRAPVGIGKVSPAQTSVDMEWWLGRKVGEDHHQLSVNELPLHSHSFKGGSHSFLWGAGGLVNQVSAPGANAVAAQPVGNELVTSQNVWNSTNDTGAGWHHNNIQSSIGINFIIKT